MCCPFLSRRLRCSSFHLGKKKDQLLSGILEWSVEKRIMSKVVSNYCVERALNLMARERRFISKLAADLPARYDITRRDGQYASPDLTKKLLNIHLFWLHTPKPRGGQSKALSVSLTRTQTRRILALNYDATVVSLSQLPFCSHPTDLAPRRFPS